MAALKLSGAAAWHNPRTACRPASTQQPTRGTWPWACQGPARRAPASESGVVGREVGPVRRDQLGESSPRSSTSSWSPAPPPRSASRPGSSRGCLSPPTRPRPSRWPPLPLARSPSGAHARNLRARSALAQRAPGRRWRASRPVPAADRGAGTAVLRGVPAARQGVGRHLPAARPAPSYTRARGARSVAGGLDSRACYHRLRWPVVWGASPRPER